MRRARIAFCVSDTDIREALLQELQAIKQKNPDNDAPLSVISKEIIRHQIGRSPDFADMVMLRMAFEMEKTHYGDLGFVIASF